MKKRISILLLTLLLAVGLLAVTSMAEETTPVYRAVYADSVNADGNLSELWLFSGDNVFDAMWSGGDTLYLAVKTGGADLTVTLNDTEFTASGDPAELEIPFSDFGLTLLNYDQTVPMTIRLGETTVFDGLLAFSGAERTQQITSFSGGIVTNASGNSVENVTGGVRMKDLYNNGSNTGNGRIYQYKPDLAAYSDRTKTLWLEFDFHAENMPVVAVGDPVDNTFTNWGFSLWMSHAKNIAAGFGIVNTADGLTGIAGARLSDAYRSFDLGREVGDTFHVTLGWTPDDEMLVYIDGKLVASMDDVIIPSTGAFINNGVYMSLWRRNSKPAGAADDYDVTVTNMMVGAGASGTVLDSLTLESILGGNESAQNITCDLVLSDTLSNGQLLPLDMVWSSSDPSVVAADGKVTPQNEDKTVILTATLTEIGCSKTFEVIVPKLQIKAAIAGSAVNRDGQLNDAMWYDRTPFYQAEGENAPSGTFSSLWDAQNLYLGVAYENADDLVVTLGERTFTLSLTDGSFPENNMGAAAIVGDGSAEVTIPFESLGILPADYNRLLTSVTATLSNDTGSARLADGPVDLIVTGNVAETFTGFAGLTSVSVSNGTATFEVPAGANRILGGSGKSWMNRDYDISIVQTLCFNSMPVVDGKVDYDYNPNDRYYFLFQLHPNYQMIHASIYNSGEGKLKLRIANGKKDDSAPAAIDLGVSMGDTFRLETVWKTDDSLHFYVDGQWKGSFENAGYTCAFSGSNWLYLRYNSTSEAASFTVSGMGAVTNACETIANEITKEAIFGSTDLTNVTENLPLVTSFPSSYLGNLPLEWASSNEAVIARDGTVTRPAGKENAKVTLKLSVGGRMLWRVLVTVPGLASGDVPAAIDASFCESISLDGAINELGWNMNGTLSDTVRFGAQWDNTNLYLAFEGSAPTAVTLNNTAADLSAVKTTGTVTEMAVSLQSLGITVSDYGVVIPAVLTTDGGSWSGNLVLTSVERHDSSNSAHRYQAQLGTTGLSYTDTMHANAVQIHNGWNINNLYDPDGNAASVGRNRVYAIFNRDAELSAALADETAARYVEFDLRVDALPITTASETMGWDRAIPCYGFTWYFAGPYYEYEDLNFSDYLMMGVFRTKDGLMLAVRADAGTQLFKLDRELGDQFRLGIVWQTDASAVIRLDGEQLAVVEGAEGSLEGMGQNLLSFNLWHKAAPANSDENTDVTFSNVAVGKYYGDDLLDTVTFDLIRGENTDPCDIHANLKLPTVLENRQLSGVALTWTSSDPAVITAEGVVTIPAVGGKLVTLTAALDNGESTSITVYVKGEAPAGSVLLVEDDRNPATGVGIATNEYRLALDDNSNSVVAVLAEKQTVNLVTLKDSDTAARLNEEVLSLWVSDDNATYTRVKDFQLLHQGQYWYLYGFETEGKYVKVHCSHYDGAEADLIGIPAESIISASYKAELAGTGFPTETSVTVTNETTLDKCDDVWIVDGEAQQVWLNGQVLYHYVEDGVTYVRIPEVKAGASVSLKLLSGKADAMDISNKEFVYEVTYGTRTHNMGEEGVFLHTLPNGVVLGVSGSIDPELYRAFSYDGGLTWEDYEVIPCSVDYVTGCGSFIVDSHTGRIFFEGHYYEGFDAEDESKSHCEIRLIYSDDNGVTWNRLGAVETDSNYILSYANGIELSCYDGAGPNVDFVLPAGAQYQGGSFCARMIYSDDAGQTWKTSDSKITYGNEDTSSGESGLSEGTVLEREDGALVYYIRCQSPDANKFAKSYSYDHGLTWVTPAVETAVYTVNTQPILHRHGESELLIWSGNNILGGNSYCRAPLSIAVSRDGLETFEVIQDLYVKTSLQAMTKATLYQCNNPSVTSLEEEDVLLISWTYHTIYTDKLIRTRVEDFTNWLYRTKGAYDSFEHGTVKYEGWSTITGTAALTDAHKTEGSYAMKISVGGAAVRSVPYLTEGVVAMDIYSLDGNLSVELQSTHSPIYGKGSPVGFQAEDGVITFLGAEAASGLTLREGWNTVEFVLGDGVTLSVNGGEPVSMPNNTAIGDYVTYVYVANQGDAICIDRFMVQDVTTEIIPEKTEARPDVEIAGTTMTLGNDLAMNFVLEARKVTGEGWYAEIAHGDKVTTLAQSDWTVSGDYFRISYNGLAAKEMTDEIVITIYDADGNVLTSKTDSIRGYAMRMFGEEVAFDTVLADMLNYGAAAQLQFKYKTDDLANSLMTDEQKACASAGVEMTDIRESASGYQGATLELESNIVLNFYYSKDYVGKTATVSYTDHYGKNHNYAVVVEANGSLGKVSVDKLVISDCSVPVTVTIDGVSVVDSVESYCARMTTLALGEPLMKFAISAKNYFAK